jgi:hypothetical protein
MNETNSRTSEEASKVDRCDDVEGASPRDDKPQGSPLFILENAGAALKQVREARDRLDAIYGDEHHDRAENYAEASKALYWARFWLEAIVAEAKFLPGGLTAAKRLRASYRRIRKEEKAERKAKKMQASPKTEGRATLSVTSQGGAA